MAYPFAAAEVLTAVDLNAMIGAPTQNAITTVTYTAVLLDAGKTVTLSNASAVTLTIPAQASVSWADNTQLNFLNIGAGTVTITPAAGVTINGTPLTLETSKGGSLVRTASNTWTFIPFSAGGVNNANFTNAATGTYTDGDSYKYITFTGSGSLIIDVAGYADILFVPSGGGGASAGGNEGGGGGGAGGYAVQLNVFLTAGTKTVTVGAGGAIATVGNKSGIDGTLFNAGGGQGGIGRTSSTIGGFGGNSGGSGNGAGSVSRVGLQGFNGGVGTGFEAPYRGGGGGGSTANGATGVASGDGGAGLSSSITNTAIGYGGGGGGGAQSTVGLGADGGANGGTAALAPSAAAANRGGGGGGHGSGPGNPGSAGGSGVVIVRVAI